jgi:hypothetical protein
VCTGTGRGGCVPVRSKVCTGVYRCVQYAVRVQRMVVYYSFPLYEAAACSWMCAEWLLAASSSHAGSRLL